MITPAAERLVTVDFGAGVQPAVQWFKSVAILLALDGSGEDFVVPAEVLAEWIPRYDAWYKRAAGILEGRRLHLVYHREVALVGHVPLERVELVAKIGRACRAVGIGFSVTVDVAQALDQSRELERLLDAGVLSNVGVNHLDGSERPSDDAARSMIEGLLGRGVTVGLIGPVHYFRSIGVLGSSVLNAANMTLHPRSQSSANAPGPENPVASCFTRFRLFVDTDGSFYPCIGLLGAPAARFGSVYEDLEDTVFGGRPTPLDIERLARAGPSWAANRSLIGPRRSGPSSICERHRLEMLGATQDLPLKID